QTTHVGAETFIDEGHLLAYKQPPYLVILDVDLRLGKHGRVGGAFQELNQKIEIHAAGEHPRMQRIGQSRGRAGRAAQASYRIAKALGVGPFDIHQDRVVEIVRGKNLVSIRRPTNAKLIQEIARHLDDPGFNQNLRSSDIELFDQLQDLREEMNVGGY